MAPDGVSSAAVKRGLAWRHPTPSDAVLAAIAYEVDQTPDGCCANPRCIYNASAPGQRVVLSPRGASTWWCSLECQEEWQAAANGNTKVMPDRLEVLADLLRTHCWDRRGVCDCGCIYAWARQTIVAFGIDAEHRSHLVNDIGDAVRSEAGGREGRLTHDFLLRLMDSYGSLATASDAADAPAEPPRRRRAGATRPGDSIDAMVYAWNALTRRRSRQREAALSDLGRELGVPPDVMAPVIVHSPCSMPPRPWLIGRLREYMTTREQAVLDAALSTHGELYLAIDYSGDFTTNEVVVAVTTDGTTHRITVPDRDALLGPEQTGIEERP